MIALANAPTAPTTWSGSPEHAKLVFDARNAFGSEQGASNVVRL